MAHLPSLFLLYSANTLVPLGQGLFAVLISYVILTAVLLSGGKSSWRMLFYTLSVCRLKDVLKMLFILSLIIMEKIDFYSTFPVHWWLKLLYNACLIHPLMTESAIQGADRSSGAIWGFSVLLKDTFTYIKLAITKWPTPNPWATAAPWYKWLCCHVLKLGVCQDIDTTICKG